MLWSLTMETIAEKMDNAINEHKANIERVCRVLSELSSAFAVVGNTTLHHQLRGLTVIIYTQKKVDYAWTELRKVI